MNFTRVTEIHKTAQQLLKAPGIGMECAHDVLEAVCDIGSPACTNDGLYAVTLLGKQQCGEIMRW